MDLSGRAWGAGGAADGADRCTGPEALSTSPPKEDPPVFDWLKTRNPQRQRAAALYNRMVALARAPRFYAELGVPDTVEGRFEMIVLHVALALRRLHGVDETLAEQVLEVMWGDLDRSIRELGVGDLSVSKKMRLLARSFYGRATSYDAALQAGDEAGLAAALVRNVHDDEPPSPAQITALVAYVRETAARADLLEEPQAA
jgi:cytochrome b pre-mRNA-processing protein 3